MIRNKFVRSAVLAIATGPAAAYGTTIVIPGTDAATNSNGGNDFPFNLASQLRTELRYQQVYGSSAFATGPILVTGIAFRLDETALFGVAFSTTLTSTGRSATILPGETCCSM